MTHMHTYLHSTADTTSKDRQGSWQNQWCLDPWSAKLCLRPSSGQYSPDHDDRHPTSTDKRFDHAFINVGESVVEDQEVSKTKIQGLYSSFAKDFQRKLAWPKVQQYSAFYRVKKVWPVFQSEAIDWCRAKGNCQTDYPGPNASADLKPPCGIGFYSCIGGFYSNSTIPVTQWQNFALPQAGIVLDRFVQRVLLLSTFPRQKNREGSIQHPQTPYISSLSRVHLPIWFGKWLQHYSYGGLS